MRYDPGPVVNTIETIEIPYPLGLLSVPVAGTATAPPDAGNWGPDEWAAWATWHAHPGETIGVFRDRIVSELNAAGVLSAHIFIYGCSNCWERNTEGRVSLKPDFLQILERAPAAPETGN